MNTTTTAPEASGTVAALITGAWLLLWTAFALAI